MLTAADRAKLADAAGCTPLQFLLSVMIDANQAPLELRLEAAKIAAPYMHRRMPIALELPNSPAQVDIAKLLALPRDEREKLLATLTKLGVNIGVTAPTEVGGMPIVNPALAGPIARYKAKADERGVALDAAHAEEPAAEYRANGLRLANGDPAPPGTKVGLNRGHRGRVK